MYKDDEWVPVYLAALQIKAAVTRGSELGPSTDIIRWVRRNIAKSQQASYLTKLAEVITSTSDLSVDERLRAAVEFLDREARAPIS